MARRRTRFVEDFTLGGGKDGPDAIDELEGILLSVKVDVDRVEFVVVLVLVVRIVCGQMPLFVSFDFAHYDCY